jgi:magnesium-transporting ATPase (P-type)
MADDGVKVKILIGDNELVARHVCSEVGLNVERIVLGDEVDQMTDARSATWRSERPSSPASRRRTASFRRSNAA